MNFMEILRAKKPRLSMDLAPLIDVVFQLLVFFMLTSTFASPSIQLDLPNATRSAGIQHESVRVSVDKNGNLFLNDQPVTWNLFTKDLEKILMGQENRAVQIEGDKDMPYKFFVRIMDLAKSAGADHVNVVYQREDQ